ncbi:FapA family protein [Crassaminicella profunda]|uniref:FapA family protein n=1 Tax=Crassaminicella profunda TaxID=1286698 RepID=UPI001CA772BB|nr:FapA family protein [Crassaminicella profunda]QZY56777.1 FapA family protein [Crassaminicella profunda]
MDKKSIITEGKTLEEAIKNGLELLNMEVDDVDVKVLEEGKSFFGILKKNFKVKLTEKIIKYEKNDVLENENENGRFELDHQEGNDCLLIMPSKGVGKPVTAEEIILGLEKKEITNIDIDKLKSSLKENKFLSINIKDLEISNPVDAKVEIEIAKDEMKAYMTILPPKGGRMIVKEDIESILKNYHIEYGIDKDLINEIISEKKYNQRHVIATGKSPVNGQDGTIKYYFNTDTKIKPEIDQDGKVDYKELNIVQCVKKGDNIAEKVMPTDGIDGMTITGKVLKAKSGKTIRFKKGKNVVETEDGLKLIADVAGQAKLVNDKVEVLQVYEVNGNVDHSTGNIYFVGNVIIRGNVRSGFKIECSEDIEVHGVVEGATIIANGNIVLHKGIHGQNVGKLISKKDIVSKYMESCYAQADGSINAEVIMHCHLKSKESIRATGKKGLIVGGEIRANMEVNAKCIGSPMATVTKLEVGIDPEIKERYESLKQELEMLYKNKDNVRKAIELLTKISKNTELSKEKQEILIKSKSTKKYLNQKIESVNKALIDLQNILQDLSSGRINSSSIIHPGVRMAIGNSVYYVRDDIQCSTILREDGEIKIVPYLGK